MNDKIRILYIDDYELDRELVKDALEKEHGGFEVTEASNKLEFEALLKTREFDVVLSDFNIAGFEGFQVLEIVRAHDPRLPVIVVTGTGSEEIAVMALKQGASDYVIKEPKHIRRLPQTILAAIEKKALRHQREKAEDKLRQSEEMFRVAFEDAPVGMCLVNPDGGFRKVNGRLCHMLGYTERELLSKGFEDITHPDDLDASNEWVRKLLAGETTILALEKRYLHKAGHVVWGIVRSFLLRKPDGFPHFFVTHVQDITDRKKAEEEVKQSKARLELAAAATNIGHWDWNLLTDEVYFSPLWKGQLGYKDHEVPNRFEEWETRLHPDDCDRAMKAVTDYIEGRSPEYRLEFRLRHKDGTYRWIYTRAEKQFDDDGRPCRLFGCHIDITERKRMEEELLRAQKLESVGALAGGIAHDFNNILTTILGNISLAKIQVTPENQLFELLGEAETASARAQTLTKQLLTFAKGGAPVKETASIKDILKESCSFVLRGSKSRSEFSISEDLWPAEVDVGQISQVINNIVINANQAMPKGGTIQVAADNLIIEARHSLPVKPGRYVKVSIKDQGVGIAEDHLLNIFDPYFTTKQEGSGLGLATTYSIIKKHNGHVTVESRLGVGTTFHIYLPASAKIVPEKEEVKIIKGQGRILVMDDEAPLRIIVGRMLEKLGYEAEFAEDGAEAIRMVKEAKEAEKPFDAVILDLTIPGGMGGKEAINKILEIDPEVKAIVSSGYSDDPVLANFQEYGFKGMMPKPFEFRSLGEVLHKVLTGVKK